MSSRSFYMTSAALLGGTGILLWFALARVPTPGSGASPSTDPGEPDDDRALGVAVADYDPVHSPNIETRQERSADPNALDVPITATRRQASASPTIPDPSQPPIAASPADDAASEASAAAQPKVIAALRADLEQRRQALRKACWPPGSNFAATFTFEIAYAADGSLLTLGVSDVPGMPGVGTCLMEQVGQKPPALPKPPGVAVAVAVPLAFDGTETPPPPPPRSPPTPDDIGG